MLLTTLSTPSVDEIPTMNELIIRVALDTPLRQLFDYLPPATGFAADPGVRVSVPFGQQQLIGIIISIENQSAVDIAKLRRINRIIDEKPVFDTALLGLLSWAADYYHHPLGEVISTALPKLAREGAALCAQFQWWSLTHAGKTALAAGEPRRAPKQLALMAHLAPLSQANVEHLNASLPGWREPARMLLAREWLQTETRAIDHNQATRPPLADGPSVSLITQPTPSPEQQAAIDAIGDHQAPKYQAWLLHGITGSGKTEVYLRLTKQHLARARRVLILVPEIGLTPQLVGRFAARFPDAKLAILHSGLTDNERLSAWRSAHSGHAHIVLGTRSAVFAPIPNLGLIVVDEEHDASFKQQEGGFRYSARDLALVRAQALGIPIVLGSATPALESLQNVKTGRFIRLSLPRRTASAQPPLLRLIDVRNEKVHAGLSSTAIAAIKRHLAAEGQVLVYINRRGYAPTLACTACGWVAPCTACDARMTVYRKSDRLRCHHCGADRHLPRECPQCGYAVKTVGQGTERVEESLADTFPGIVIARMDRDVVRRSADLEAVVAQIASGNVRILVGTQMVAKGHDFPAVTLAIVLNADQGLFSTDFRASERLAQTIVQVAGRAGRGARPGEVLIQTEYPEHPLLQGLLSGGYEAFAAAALQEREAATWPPFSHLAALRASGTQITAAIEFLEAARLSAGAYPTPIRLLGPAPAAMAKRADRHHAQLLIESADRRALHRFLRDWLRQVATLPEARRVRWALDVDPLELF